MVDTVKMRRLELPEEEPHASGRVLHDDRGNAFWEWSEDTESTPFCYAVASALEVADAAEARAIELPAGSHLKVLEKGGYNPYETGPVPKVAKPRKRNLRELSKWIEERRRRGEPTKL